jgi:cell division transport system permease protein
VITFVVFSLRRAWQGFWRNSLMSLAATLTMVLMLVLLAGFFILQNVLLASLNFVEEKVQVVAYVETTVRKAEVDALVLRLEAMPEVETIEYITRDEALRRFREAQEAQGREDLTRYLETNPLYASLEVRLTDPQYVTLVSEALRDEPAIRNVLNIEALVERVLAVTTVVRNGGIAVLGIVGLIVLFIIVNTIRLAVVARAEEIEIMRLVGASDAFIRWPFVFEGAMVGLLGAAVTIGLLSMTAEPASELMVGFFNVLPIQLGGLARDTAVIVAATGLGLGVFGSWLSVRTYLIR